jgi:hypothetical protein
VTELAITRAGAERIDDVALAVMEGNDDAARFYDRRGLLPYLRLTIGRVPPAP